MIDQEITAAIEWIYQSYVSVASNAKVGYDRDVRHPEWTRKLLDSFGAPDKSMYNVAVTGSKGKGTHAILLAAMLQQAGLRVGLFTSPHLVDFLERIRLDGEPISGNDFVRLAQQVRQAAMNLTIPTHQYFGPIGLLSVMACLWFKDKQTDVNVFELGRGALHDDVNQVVHQGAVLTPVFGEHLDKLGPTVTQVIAEKWGVVTEDTRWLVANRQTDEAWLPSQRADLRSGTTVIRYPNDFGAQVLDEEPGYRRVRTSCEGVTLEAYTDSHIASYETNIVTTLQAAYRVLRDTGYPLEHDVITFDLRKLQLPGKLQIVERENGPVCIIDGSIHALNAKLVANWIRTHARVNDAWALLSLPDDKDGVGVIRQIGPHVSHIWLTGSSNRHLSYHRDWTNEARRYVSDVRVFTDVEAAIRHLMETVHSMDLVAFLGTQSFVGDVLRTLQVPTRTIWKSGQYDA